MNADVTCAVCGGPYAEGYCEYCPSVPLPDQTTSERRRALHDNRTRGGTVTNVIECRKTTDSFHQSSVLLDGQPLDPGPSQQVWNHSPDGFSWGYGGSGPAQLALGILLAVTGDEDVATRLHQRFKDDHVARWPMETHTAQVDVAAWVVENDDPPAGEPAPDAHLEAAYEDLHSDVEGS